MPKAVRKTVERHLREYRANKAAVESYGELRQAVMLGTPNRPEGPVNEGGTGDPTGVKVVRLDELRERIAKKAVIVKAIDDVLSGLAEEDRELIEMQYFSGVYFTHERTARELNMGRTAYYSRLNWILRLFALRMGLL